MFEALGADALALLITMSFLFQSTQFPLHNNIP